jgi:hypothetical protein
MTKRIRIENADTSYHKVRVYVEDLVGGLWVRTGEVRELDYPTDLTENYVHGTRRLVVEEV